MVCMNSFLHGNSLACTLIINRPNKENPDNVKTLHSNHGNNTHYSNVVPLSRRKFRWVTWSSAQLWNSWAYKYGKRNAKRIVRWTRSNNLVLKSTERKRRKHRSRATLGPEVQFVFRFWFNLFRLCRWNVMRQLHINSSWKIAFSLLHRELS